MSAEATHLEGVAQSGKSRGEGVRAGRAEGLKYPSSVISYQNILQSISKAGSSTGGARGGTSARALSDARRDSEGEREVAWKWQAVDTTKHNSHDHYQCKSNDSYD